MRYVHRALSIAVLSGALAAAVSSVALAQDARLSNCVELQGQVRAALSSNAESPNYQEAVKQQRYGVEFCNNGFYQNGVTHYAEALKLLGASKG